MKPLTREWVQKAEGDFRTAQREYRAWKMPNYDATCFHAQQCVEKYLKACLQEKEIPFTKTHDLVMLLDMVLSLAPMWESFRQGFRELNVYAVGTRYPGESADKEMAWRAVQVCRAFRLSARQFLSIAE